MRMPVLVLMGAAMSSASYDCLTGQGHECDRFCVRVFPSFSSRFCFPIIQHRSSGSRGAITSHGTHTTVVLSLSHVEPTPLFLSLLCASLFRFRIADTHRTHL